MKPLSLSRHLFWTSSAALVLVAAGCKKKEAEFTALDGPDLLVASSVKSLVDKAKRPSDIIDEADAKAAMDFIKSEGMSWTSVSGEAGNYVFTDLSFPDDNAVAKRVEVSGLHMIDEDFPYASYLSIEELESDEFSLNKLVMNLPSAKIIDQIEALDEEDFDEETSVKLYDQVFDEFMDYTGGGYVEGIKFKESDEAASIGFMGWSKDKAKISGLIENIEVTGDENDPFNMTVGHFSIKNLDISPWGNMSEKGPMGSVMSGYMSLISPYARGYESISFRDIKLTGKDDDLDMSFDFPKGDIWFTPEKNGVFHLKSNFPKIALNVNLDKIPESDEFPKDMIQEFGWDKSRFNLTSDSRIDQKNDNIKVLHSRFNWEDNLELSTTYDVDGMSGYFKAFEKMGSDMDLESMSMGGAFGDPRDAEKLLREMIKDLKVNEFVFGISDKSLLEKSFKLAGHQQGSSAEDMRNGVKASLGLATIGATTDYRREVINDATSALSEFLDSGGTLRLTIKPDNGFDFLESFESIKKMQAEAIFGNTNTDDFDAEAAIDDILRAVNINMEHVPD